MSDSTERSGRFLSTDTGFVNTLFLRNVQMPNAKQDAYLSVSLSYICVHTAVTSCL